MPDNLRANVQILVHSFERGPMQGNLPRMEQALRDLGRAFQQRLAMQEAPHAALAPHLAIGRASVSGVHALMTEWATALATAEMRSPGDPAALGAAVLAAVPPTPLGP